jgi:hypothetical protein
VSSTCDAASVSALLMWDSAGTTTSSRIWRRAARWGFAAAQAVYVWQWVGWWVGTQALSCIGQ